MGGTPFARRRCSALVLGLPDAWFVWDRFRTRWARLAQTRCRRHFGERGHDDQNRCARNHRRHARGCEVRPDTGVATRRSSSAVRRGRPQQLRREARWHNSLSKRP